MKLLPLIFLLMAIQFSMFIFVLGNLSHDESLGPYNESDNSFFCHYVNNYTYFNDANTSRIIEGEDYNGGDLWTLIFCPAEGNSTRLMGFIIAFLILVGALGFVPLIGRSDMSFLAAPMLLLVCAAAPTIGQLYGFINSETSAFVCTGSLTSCFVSQFFAILVCGPLFIAWVMACIEWWSGRPTG